MKPVGQQIDKESEREREGERGTGVRRVPGPKWVFVFGGGEQCEPAARLARQLAALQIGVASPRVRRPRRDLSSLAAFLSPLELRKT